MKELIDKWLELTFEHFKVIEQYEIRDSRKRKHFRIRAVAMYLMRKHIKDIKLEEIGAVFGGQNHSTVINAINTVKNMYMEHVKAIEAMAKSGNQEELAI